MTDSIRTGPMKIGNDWQGIFIRGKDAIGYANVLQRLLAGAEKQAESGNLGPDDATDWGRMQELESLLRSSFEVPGAPPIPDRH